MEFCDCNPNEDCKKCVLKLDKNGNMVSDNLRHYCGRNNELIKRIYLYKDFLKLTEPSDPLKTALEISKLSIRYLNKLTMDSHGTYRFGKNYCKKLIKKCKICGTQYYMEDGEENSSTPWWADKCENCDIFELYYFGDIINKYVNNGHALGCDIVSDKIIYVFDHTFIAFYRIDMRHCSKDFKENYEKFKEIIN